MVVPGCAADLVFIVRIGLLYQAYEFTLCKRMANSSLTVLLTIQNMPLYLHKGMIYICMMTLGKS